jgi:predicted nucleotidyltransferase
MLDYPLEDAAALVALARADMELAPEELAERAAVSADTVRSIESGEVQADADLLRKLLIAAGLRPAVPLGFYRDRLRDIAASLGLFNVRVFGSTVHGLDTPTSDVDFLVQLRDTASRFALGGFHADAERILGFPVDIMLQDTVSAVGDRARAEAVPL